MVDVGVGVLGRTLGIKLVTSGFSSTDSAAGVAVAAASIGTGTDFEIGGNGDSSSAGQEEGGKGDDLWILC